MREMFKAIDADGRCALLVACVWIVMLHTDSDCTTAAVICSGTITIDEMREGLRAKGSKIMADELQCIMANADVNGDGALLRGHAWSWLAAARTHSWLLHAGSPAAAVAQRLWRCRASTFLHACAPACHK